MRRIHMGSRKHLTIIRIIIRIMGEVLPNIAVYTSVLDTWTSMSKYQPFSLEAFHLPVCVLFLGISICNNLF